MEFDSLRMAGVIALMIVSVHSVCDGTCVLRMVANISANVLSVWSNRWERTDNVLSV